MTNLTKPVDTLAKGLVDGLGAFLGRICLPAAEELGLALQDRVKAWRNRNFADIAQRGEQMLNSRKELKTPQIHPRIIHTVYEQGSWVDSDILKDMWAGILSSSCVNGEPTDKNMIYLDILSKLSHAEASLFQYFCKTTHWFMSGAGNLVVSNLIFPTINELKREGQLDNYDEVDESLSHLEFLGLIEREAVTSSDFYEPNGSQDETVELAYKKVIDRGWVDSVNVQITPLGLRLYLKVLGMDGQPAEFISELNKWNHGG